MSKTGSVLEIVPLATQWPTIDPFLFCAHHLDDYPAGDDRHGPAATLAGRNIGQDFAGVDGWNMYHGSSVPGFPQHPHRGFETISVVRQGLMDHSDSLGSTARFGAGDVQWMTAGAGIVHCEMFPLLNQDSGNPLEMFQVWLNLPRAQKMVEPYFTMLWSEDIPRVHVPGVEITIASGRIGDYVPPAPPPDSWASRPDSDVAVWHLRFDAGARFTLPPAAYADTGRVLYIYRGAGLTIDGQAIDARNGVVLKADEAVEIIAAPGSETDCVMLQGRPIGEPVAQYGPFVLNDRAGIEQAFRDYERTRFGGWPWPTDDPVHGSDPTRFARHVDGRVETPSQREGVS